MMSIKSVNAITHYTDYIIGHVHLGALGWNGGLAFAMLYFILPRIYNTKLHSLKQANWHFWLATLGMLFYAVPMYIGGITQSLMWKEFTAEGVLRYGNFLDTVTQILPMYVMRSVGGTLFLLGACIGAWNLWKTCKSGSLIRDEQASATVQMEEDAHGHHWHRFLEGRPVRFTVYVLIAVLIGGVVEFVPTALVKSNIPTIATVQPYTPLELEGRDIYIREGCYTCHSQMVRPFRSETERYGEYSKPGEFVYDHPFQWGSKRTGPDLHRVGKKYPDAWHWKHMMEPRSTSPGSIMPGYPWMYERQLDISHTEGKIITMQKLGVPYPDGYERQAVTDLKAQAKGIADALQSSGFKDATADKEIIAVIAYLQRLGTDIKKAPTAAAVGGAQ